MFYLIKSWIISLGIMIVILKKKYAKFYKLSEQNPPQVLRSYLIENKERKLHLFSFSVKELLKTFCSKLRLKFVLFFLFLN